jgi:methylenetetrahydrofolate dehydrogenase (NADP+) / methenyltetrahydrofolate cyclohydrolase
MPAQLLDGNSLARQIRRELTVEVADFIENNGVVPTLAAVLVGEDAASQVYVRNKRRDCEEVGIQSQLHKLSSSTSQNELLTLIARLNRDETVHGILVQLPLPPQIDTRLVLEAVSANKDVDAFHPENVGLVVQGRPRFLPCTPAAVQQIMVRNNVPIAGQHVVVVGRSDIVGKPLAIMLAQKGDGADATVTLCHSRTRELAAVTRQADILVAAIGKPKFITGDMIRPDATVIDVGINRTDAGLVGDVDFDAALAVAGRLTPVPGGIGPLTRVMLLVNTLTAARQLET